jgi:hypothetical protein
MANITHTPYVGVNLKKSRELSQQVEAQRGRCWYNALVAVSRVKGNAFYVEGYSVIWGRKGITLGEHGWIELDGEIIELTPDWPDWSCERIMYFPGVRYSREVALEIVHTGLEPPFVRRFDRPPPQYKTARRKAQQCRLLINRGLK